MRRYRKAREWNSKEADTSQKTPAPNQESGAVPGPQQRGTGLDRSRTQRLRDPVQAASCARKQTWVTSPRHSCESQERPPQHTRWAPDKAAAPPRRTCTTRQAPKRSPGEIHLAAGRGYPVHSRVDKMCVCPLRCQTQMEKTH